MNNSIKIYKYYQTLPSDLNKLVFIDALESLVVWIKSVNNIKDEYINHENKEYFEYFIDYFQELGMSDISWFMVYKKTDYTANKNISELIDIKTKQNISRMAMMRKMAILKLIESQIIEDLNISLDTFCSEETMIEEGLIKVKDDKKQFDLWVVLDDKLDILSVIKDWEIDKKIFSTFLCKSILHNLKTYYWEDTLNEDLNQDESYKQIICYKTDKVKLDEILLNIKKDWEKEIIEKFEIKKDNIYINWDIFKIKDSVKTPGFITLLSWYLESTTTKRIPLSELIDFYDDNYNKQNDESLTLKIGNIKNTFIKTIRKQVWKRYLNNEILKIEWSDIVLL